MWRTREPHGRDEQEKKVKIREPKTRCMPDVEREGREKKLMRTEKNCDKGRARWREARRADFALQI